MEGTMLKERGETFFLNLRFMLIAAVFVGNAIEPLAGSSTWMHGLYVWIFTFHMPLFVLVTGYFAKSSLDGEAGRRVLLQIGMQYVLFQSLYSLLDETVFHVDGIHRSFFAPYLLLWFLAGHAMWRLLLLGMCRWKTPYQLAFAAAAGLAVGYLPIDGVWFGISRTFVFFPFFVIGYHLSFGSVVSWLTAKTRVLASFVSLLLLAVCLGGGAAGLPVGWLYGSMTYGQLGAVQWASGLYRVAVYGLQAVCSLAFLGLVPPRAGRMTGLGRRTLYVFLLHGFIVRFAAASGLYSQIGHSAEMALVPAAALALTLVLAQPFFKRLLHPIIEPKVEPAFALLRTGRSTKPKAPANERAS